MGADGRGDRAGDGGEPWVRRENFLKGLSERGGFVFAEEWEGDDEHEAFLQQAKAG